MTRTVRSLTVVDNQAIEATPQLFSKFADRANIVLLGDPGAGKTYLFKERAASTGARFIRARDFFNTPVAHLRGRELFIDGLDEKRAGRGDEDTIDALVVKLFEVQPPKVRISCRAADWLGESDLAALAPYFELQGEACVLHLEGLSRDEQIAVLTAESVSADEATRFLDVAAERGLGDFLENPQNLLMLWRAVEGGTWPATRTELYEVSTGLMLAEANTERARNGVGAFTATELRPAAGAICAARLISDVGAIGLSEQEGTPDCPGYRSIDLCPRDAVQAALSRRVFDAAPEAEAVDYAHRTMAEFLAAAFLAARVRDGLPFGRIQALIGIDEHPASELRGLHAWLAVHLPEHANALIDADPYGVLAYGDAASLSTASCTALMKALARLSESNPSFRPSSWQVPAIGALARHDMIGAFRAILGDPDAGFGVRSIVIDALALGTSLPEMVPDLQAVLARPASVYAERRHAIDALMRLGDEGKDAIRTVFAVHLGDSIDDLRLHVAIVQHLYGDPYGPAEIIALIRASLTVNSSLLSGTFWFLADSLPLADVPAILDGIAAPATDADDFELKSREASSFYARLIVRAWPVSGDVAPARIIGWLRKRFDFKGSMSGNQARDLRAAMQATPDRLTVLAVDFFAQVPADADRWLALSRFREVTLHELKAGDLAPIAVEAFEQAEAGGDRRLFLYEAALALSMGTAIFDDIFARADYEPGLEAAREAAVVTRLPDNYFAGRSGRAPKIDHRSKQQQDFDREVSRIRSGMHLGWLSHLARLYFALYSDVDRRLAPRERIAGWLGAERVDAALEGLAATLTRSDLPSFDAVLALLAKHKHFDWWYALLAGLNEHWAAGQGLGSLTDDFLKAMLAFDLAHPVWAPEGDTERIVVHPWRAALTTRRPDLVRDSYLAIARIGLSRTEPMVGGLHELLTEPALAPSRPDVVLELLRDFPDTDPFRLADLLDAAVALPSIHQAVLALAEPILAGAVTVGVRQHDLWLATAYTLAPARFEYAVRQRAVACPGFVFNLRNRCRFGRNDEPDQPQPLPVLEFLAQLTGALHPEAPYPTDGWSGDTNPWDASDYFRTLINMISASPSAAATGALERLAADPQLDSYRPQLLAALDRQRQRRRDTEYDRPNWAQTLAALANRAPATVADLHALLIAQLRDLAHRIARANTDVFRQFWNVDRYGKPINPRPEELCRDSVITLLRPVMQPLGIILEPEGHMVADKRADISVAMPGRKILCELKRDYHAEVWTAVTGQLERFYAHDPEAKGFGVYVVFWFGGKRPQPIPRLPGGMTMPKSAPEMEVMLRSLLSEEQRKRLAVIVMDVSGDV